jgi:cation diffusion facilitator CzcD-associated flavoprotein CzcO
VTSTTTATDAAVDYDAVVIGAGITGIYQLYRLREQGFRVRLLEAGSGVGGTWFWNRYPGCRFDSESYTYGYFFSQELREEWSWSEEYASQPETERYLNHVVDRFGLREHIELNARVSAAVWNEGDGCWQVTTEAGTSIRTTFLITAVGILSAPIFPNVPGLEHYTGEWHHTALWPNDEVSFAGKRVAVVGTGSSGVQIVPIVAREAESLTVFQRTPNWCTPINNAPITPERMAEIRAMSDELHARCLASPSGSMHSPKPTLAMELSDEERTAAFEELYNAPGLTMSLAGFRDVSTTKEANDLLTAYLADKIRGIVHDPETARRLIPTDHGFGQKRPPLENGYYATFNRENVSLVSLLEQPMTRFTEKGIETSEGEYEFDLIVIATGFEAVVGSFNRIDIRGVDGLRLRDHWEGGPRTYLGLASSGFPNMFIVGGPQSTAGNIPRYTESQVDWVTECLVAMRDAGQTRVEATHEAEEGWIELIYSTIQGTLQETAKSWAWGSNVPGAKRGTFLLYAGGLPRYRTELSQAKEAGYRALDFAGGR